MKYKNITRALHEVDVLRGKQEAIYCALNCMEDWNYHDSVKVVTARNLLIKEAERYEKQIADLNSFIKEGEPDLEIAMQLPLVYTDDQWIQVQQAQRKTTK